MNLEAIENWLANTAGGYHLEKEVLDTFRSYCSSSPPQNEEEAYRHAWDALYEWDI